MGLFSELLAQHPELEGIKGVLADIEKNYEALQRENETLREELARAQSSPGKTEFDDAYGMLWKRKHSGGYESMPYCPTCKSVLTDYSGSLLCLRCNWQAPIKSFEVTKVFNDLFGGK